LILVFIALIISVLSFGQQSISSIQNITIAEEANKKADAANRVAEKALEIAFREHQEKVIPQIAGFIGTVIINADFPEDDYVRITLKNQSHSNAYILKIYIIGLFNLKVSLDDQYPIELLYNNETSFFLTLKKGLRSSIVSEVFENALQSKELIEINLSQLTTSYLESTQIQIDYHNELNLHYTTTLAFDESEGEFIGEVKRIPSDWYKSV
jgi:hypothetical protein